MESLKLTIYDIKNGEENLKKAHKLLLVFYSITLTAFALFLIFKIFLLFLLLLGVLFCTALLYAGILPRKRKRFYDRYREGQKLEV